MVSFKNFSYRSIFLLFIAVTCGATECHKDYGRSYAFNETIDLYPEQEVYHLGDTIWLGHYNAPRTLYDKPTNQYFSFDTLSVAFGPTCSTVYNLPEDNSNSFCNFIWNGVNQGPYFSHIFGCSNGGDFNFRVAMVLNKRGTFSIDLNGTRPVAPCNFTNPYIGIGFPESYILYKFNIRDGHKAIYLGVTPARRAVDKDYVYALLDNKQIFFFKVE